MKFRQVESERRSVDRKDLKAGDYVEYCGGAFVVCGGELVWFAFRLDGREHGPLADPVYRIRITGEDDDGKLTWERIQVKPKPVTWNKLKAGDWFCYEYNLYVAHGGGARLCREQVIAFSADGQTSLVASDHDILYRAEPCGFELEDCEPVILWRTK